MVTVVSIWQSRHSSKKQRAVSSCRPIQTAKSRLLSPFINHPSYMRAYAVCFSISKRLGPFRPLNFGRSGYATGVQDPQLRLLVQYGANQLGSAQAINTQ